MSRRSQHSQELQERYKSLQLDWQSFKQSNPRTSTQRTLETKPTTPSIVDLMMDSSPRDLVSSLQGKPSPSEDWKVRTNDLAVEEGKYSPSEGWKVRTNDLAVEEFINSNGKFKGRRLFEEFEDVASEMDARKEEICSACSSVLIQNGERNSWSCSFAGEEVGNHVLSAHNSGRSYMDGVEGREPSDGLECKKMVLSQRNGDRWMVRAGWLAFVLVVFALAIISWRSIDTEDDTQVLVPT